MELYLKIRNGLYSRIFRFLYQNKFKHFGMRSRIILPLNLNGVKNITIGESVYVAYKSWLAAVPLPGEAECELIIGDGSSIGNFNHIYATKSIVIGKNVLTADKVYISDNLHEFEDVTVPIIHQQIKQIGTVVIGDGTWIGENVCIIGAKVGRNCVIGANAVVTKDMPDFCVAVGAPSYIIKKFCQDSNEWKKTDKVGNFLE
jgi:acetyltransferase-like isoleucine patch superfamily enzyme